MTYDKLHHKCDLSTCRSRATLKIRAFLLVGVFYLYAQKTRPEYGRVSRGVVNW